MIGVQLVSSSPFPRRIDIEYLQLSLRVLALYKNDRRLRAGLIVWLTLCHGALWAMALESIIRFYRASGSLAPSTRADPLARHSVHHVPPWDKHLLCSRGHRLTAHLHTTSTPVCII